jgi:hypothetical protein
MTKSPISKNKRNREKKREYLKLKGNDIKEREST